MEKGEVPPYTGEQVQTGDLSQTAQSQGVYYPPLPQEQGPTTVILTAPQIMPFYGPVPQPSVCPHCHKEIITRIQSEPTFKTHLLAVLLCLICCMPCIPYCIDSCQNTSHYCPNCSAFLGTFDSDKMGGRQGYF